MPTCDRCENGKRQSGYHSVSFSAFSQFIDGVLLHIRFTLRWVRHNRAARFVSALLQTGPAKITATEHLNPQVPCVTTCQRVARHCYAAPCGDETTCVAVRYLTLRPGCSRGRTPKVVRPQQRKNPLPFPISQRSHVGNLRQTIQGKGVIHKRVETAGVYPLVPRPGRPCPAEFQRKTHKS